ncbi:hypothetical protein BDY19DRAFT_497019 [Irpex rosettiformis]|uniref:Uncharacterized protein n=1 Tax=Irpex rosettiformis TaxID=378272 RepID=A0ACB8UEE5_9APHY|nr:hypothetical protein BDY19DRAFT_497019 [Irpex rosettiformis]
MRIKVESTPPLTTFKAWFVVSTASTIQDLKESICSDIPALHKLDVDADELTLVIDGFELLDSSPIDVVRDGDLVNVRQRVAHVKADAKKRKAESTADFPALKRAKSTPAVKPKTIQHTTGTQAKAKNVNPSPSSSSESSSDTSDDSSSSSDDPTSDSDDDDDDTSNDSSSTSSDSSPSVETSKARPAQQKLTKVVKPQATVDAPKPKPAENSVPPGQGKTATKKRNLRRRLKKHYERLGAEQALNGLFGVNNVPLGPRASTSAQVQEESFEVTGDDDILPTPPTIMMASLSNKNKRKGFKQAMASTLPKKIVFSTPDDESTEAEQTALPFPAASTSEVAATAPSIFPRLIPPSEKQENGQIPVNMIVTSIDVEEGLYPSRKKNKKQGSRQQQLESEIQQVENVVPNYGEEDGDHDMIPTQRTADVAPSGGEVEPLASTRVNYSQVWEVTEEHWETLPKIRDPEYVLVGNFVGWKALGFNAATYTPEILLNVGITKKVGETLVVQPLPRPGATSTPSGRALAEVEAEEEFVPEEEAYEWIEVISGDWKDVGIYKPC